MRPVALMWMLFACAIALAPLTAASKIGGGDIIYSPNGADKVTFQHEYHVNIKGMRCSNCHYKTFQMSGTSAYQMNMATLTKGQFCGSCHDGKQAFDAKDSASCARCHRS